MRNEIQLTVKEVAEIKWRLLNGESASVLADMYGKSLWTMRAIRRGEVWRHVEAKQPGMTKTEAQIKAEGERALALILADMPVKRAEPEPDPMVEIMARLSGDIGKAKAEKARVDGMIGQLTGDDDAGKEA